MLKTLELDPQEIQPYANNPRVNDHAVDKIAESIKTYGFVQPIVIDENNIIIIGETRWKAAVKLGLKKIPVIMVTGFPEDKKKALRIADNQLATLSFWDIEKLKKEYEGLEPAFKDLLFFDPEKLKTLLSFEILNKPDLAPNDNKTEYGSPAFAITIYNIKCFIDAEDLSEYVTKLDQALIDTYGEDQKKFNKFGERVLRLIRKNEKDLIGKAKK